MRGTDRLPQSVSQRLGGFSARGFRSIRPDSRHVLPFGVGRGFFAGSGEGSGRRLHSVKPGVAVSDYARVTGEGVGFGVLLRQRSGAPGSVPAPGRDQPGAGGAFTCLPLNNLGGFGGTTKPFGDGFNGFAGAVLENESAGFFALSGLRTPKLWPLGRSCASSGAQGAVGRAGSAEQSPSSKASGRGQGGRL